MKQFCLGIALLFMIACITGKPGTKVEQSGLFKYPRLTMKEAVAFENKIGSTDNSYDHFVGISEGLYPNRHNYNLTSVKTFLRKDTAMNYSVSYYSTDDDSVRVILYGWDTRNAFSQQNDTVTIRLSTAPGTVIRQMDDQFFDLEKKMLALLGSPTYKDIHPDTATETVRDDIKWESPGTLNVYLLRFKDAGGYREIRMAVYPR